MFPSLWYEGQPLIVLEPKSVGTPVIVSDGCAGREEITNRVDGLWFRSGDARDLVRALKAFQTGDIAAMAQAAYAGFWANPPTIERHVDGITAIYGDLLERAASIREAERPARRGIAPRPDPDSAATA